MGKLNYEDIISLYNERKSGISILSLCSKYKICDTRVEYLIRLIDKHGFNALRTNKNKYYSPDQKEQIINRILIDNESYANVSVDIGLSSQGILHNWVKKYKENGYNIVERKRGRPTMNKKELKPKKNETLEEENERLKKENLYLKAELEYSKKLRAVVQARKNQQQKKK